VYHLPSTGNASLAASVGIAQTSSLHVMGVTQSGNYLYLALGNHFNTSQAGLAIVDVTIPGSPSVTDVFVVPGSASGASIVKVEGAYAYLGAMQSGLVVLGIGDKSNITMQSQFVPSINYPPVTNPNPDLFNARGMEVSNMIVYLCYDAGGIRVVNCKTPTAPVETGRWCNPAMYTPMNYPKAYNNCILDDSLLYVAVDYAGLEVLNVKDTANIKLRGWWNPYNAPANNWFSSPVHTNEMAYEKGCRRVFLSTGKSDMIVVDVSNPASPDSCNFYGGVSNGMGTWGVSQWKNEIYLSYICAVIPFSSNWTGVKVLTFNPCITGMDEMTRRNTISVLPNPVAGKALVRLEKQVNEATLLARDISGKAIFEIRNLNGMEMTLDIPPVPAGLYFLSLYEDHVPTACVKIAVTVED
jgi:hypothetical protein